MIAAHARSLGYVLVTNNTKDFTEIDGLVLDTSRVESGDKGVPHTYEEKIMPGYSAFSCSSSELGSLSGEAPAYAYLFTHAGDGDASPHGSTDTSPRAGTHAGADGGALHVHPSEFPPP